MYQYQTRSKQAQVSPGSNQRNLYTTINPPLTWEEIMHRINRRRESFRQDKRHEDLRNLRKRERNFNKAVKEMDREADAGTITEIFYNYFPEERPLPTVNIDTRPVKIEYTPKLSPTEFVPLVERLHNGEKVPEGATEEQVQGFNDRYDRATANGAEIPQAVWNFDAYLRGESVVGNYVANYIQQLPERPADYVWPATFELSGVQPTYDAARLYKNCMGNCYSTSASRVNKGYEDLYGFTPIDYSSNSDGLFLSQDYKTASTQSGASNYGYGVGGALANGGEGTLVDNEGVWNGELKPGAALQIWHSTDPDNFVGSGHSQLFLGYIYDETTGEITGISVYDNSGAVETMSKEYGQANETILGANLNDQ